MTPEPTLEDQLVERSFPLKRGLSEALPVGRKKRAGMSDPLKIGWAGLLINGLHQNLGHGAVRTAVVGWQGMERVEWMETGLAEWLETGLAERL